jgi:putative thioredoxin
VLEKLVAADGGRWVLGTIDTEAEQRLAAAFQVQSIPSVFAVIGGQPVPLFQGALPEAQVRRYLDELLKVATANGITGTAEVSDAVAAPPEPEPIDPRYDAAYDAVERGDWDAAETSYRALLADAPADAEAMAGLVQVQLLRRVSSVDPAQARAAANARPQDVEAQITAADVDMLEGAVEAAFSRLVETVRRTAGEERNAARVHLVELFDLLGPTDPRVMKARSALTSALF